MSFRADFSPRHIPRFSKRWSWWAFFTFALAAVACWVPLLMAHTPEVGFALLRAFALVCHQRPERCFFLFGGSVAVCARCLGIYLGAALGLLLRVPRRVAMQFLIAALAANVADRIAEFAGWHGNWMLVRFVLGIGLGTAATMLIAASTTREGLAPAMSHRSRSIPHARF
jgi:uncharacterized membrane protein